MKVVRLVHTLEDGWGAPFPDLDGSSTLVVVFGAPEYAEVAGPFKELGAHFPRSHVIGCSTAGEIHGSEVRDRSLAVAIVSFDSTLLGTAVAEVPSAGHSRSAGRHLAGSLDRPSLKGIFVLSDGLGVNGSELVGGFNDVLGSRVVVTGGLAGDGPRFGKTWTLVGGHPAGGRVTAVGFYGDAIRIGHGSQGGWDLFGPLRTITRSEGHILYELDGRPALELYKEYLGDLAEGLPANGLLFPLAIRRQASDSEETVRTILAVDETQQSLVFAGDVPQGYVAQLMQANFDRLIDGAEEAAGRATKLGLGHGAVLSLAISCVGRRLVLGERTEEEVEATLDILPTGTEQVGFYSYGEISPHASGTCDLHNQTMTLTTLGEVG